MTRAESAQPYFLPPPIGGMRTDTIFAPVSVNFARYLRDYVISGGLIVSRGAQQKDVVFTPGTTHGTINWSTFTPDNILWSNGTIRTTGNTLLYTSTITGVPTEFTFADQLYLMNEGQAAIVRSGTTWGAFPFTLDVLLSTEIICGCTYKSRQYFAGPTGFEYAEEPGLITGNTIYFDIEAELAGDEIIAIRSISINPGLTNEVVLGVFGELGTVLIYSGDNPDASSWTLIGKYNVSKPRSKFGFVEVDGNLFVMGLDLIYNVRDLLSAGTEQARVNAITNPIADLYRGTSMGFTSASPCQTFAFHYPKLDCIIFNFALFGSVESGAGSLVCQLVYFRKDRAWVLWRIPQFNYPARLDSNNLMYWRYYQSGLFYSPAAGISDTVVPDGFSIVADVEEPIVQEWRTPYFIEDELRNCNAIAVIPQFNKTFVQVIPGFYHPVTINYGGFVNNLQDATYSIPGVTFTQLSGMAVLSQFASLQPFDSGSLTTQNYNYFEPYLIAGLKGRAISAVLQTGGSNQSFMKLHGMNFIVQDGGIL